MQIGVIGTAGRGNDYLKLNELSYQRVYTHFLRLLDACKPEDRNLQSGGAAWMDHLAVKAFLDKRCNSLKLYLPCRWGLKAFLRMDGQSIQIALTATYYHRIFSRIAKIDSFAEIQAAIDQGAELHCVRGGFKERNLDVGMCHVLIAYTFNNKDYPRDGGTKHCWDHSVATTKIHFNLDEVIGA